MKLQHQGHDIRDRYEGESGGCQPGIGGETQIDEVKQSKKIL